MTKEKLKGPPCNRCGSEMLPHPVTMFGASWHCTNKNCAVAYRIDRAEKELYLKLKEAGLVWKE